MNRICPEYLDAHPSDLFTAGDARFREHPDDEEDEEEDDKKDEGDGEEGDQDDDSGYSE